MVTTDNYLLCKLGGKTESFMRAEHRIQMARLATAECCDWLKVCNDYNNMVGGVTVMW